MTKGNQVSHQHQIGQCTCIDHASCLIWMIAYLYLGDVVLIICLSNYCFIISVKVYKCAAMADKCGSCLMLDPKYECGWCNNHCSIEDQCDAVTWLDADQYCPDPVITSVSSETWPHLPIKYLRAPHEPQTRYVKLRVTHAPGMPRTFSPPPISEETAIVSDPGMHCGTYVTHVPWRMSVSLTCGGGENIPGIPGACATHNFTNLIRGPLMKPSTFQEFNSNEETDISIDIRCQLNETRVFLVDHWQITYLQCLLHHCLYHKLWFVGNKIAYLPSDSNIGLWIYCWSMICPILCVSIV